MPRLDAALALVALTSSICLAQTSPTTAPSSLEGAPFLTLPGRDWKLLWHDEFHGNALDANTWKIGLPWKGSDGEGRHHDDRYASYIVDHNVLVEGGVLKLLTRREDVVDKRGRTFHYTQGLITTAHSFRHAYGYWEARVKIPVEAGPGLWPAFWTLAKGWPPEMDICEVWTSTNRAHQGMAYRPDARGKERWDDVDSRDAPLPLGWNTFGMEWGPGYQIYNINGRITKRVYGEHVTDVPNYILLNSGVDAQSPPTAATVFPNAFEVDYVRVYDRPGVPALHNGGFEDGDRPWKRTGQTVRVAYAAHGGKLALRVDGGGAAEQKVYGLNPKTRYELRGWVKSLAGAAQLSAGEQYVESAKREYEELRVPFTTGADATTAVIRCTVPDKAGAALFDDLSITVRPDPTRPGS